MRGSAAATVQSPSVFKVDGEVNVINSVLGTVSVAPSWRITTGGMIMILGRFLHGYNSMRRACNHDDECTIRPWPDMKRELRQ